MMVRSFPFSKTFGPAISIELNLMEPSKRVLLSRSMDRKRMRIALVDERRGEGAAGAEGIRAWPLQEKERFVEHDIP
jgi:hypothetical protein